MRRITNVLVILSALLAGCTSTQMVHTTEDAVAGTAGALVGAKLSNNNPYWTAGGAVAAIGATTIMQNVQESSDKKQLALAYERGQSQAAQRDFEAIQDVQRHSVASATEPFTSPDLTKIPIELPERTVNGVTIKATTEYVTLHDQ